MANTFVGVASTSEPNTVQAEFGYPENCYVNVYRFLTTDKQAAPVYLHEIYYHGAPAALFNNAPIGSRCWDTSTPAVWLKTAAAGTGTWVSETLS